MQWFTSSRPLPQPQEPNFPGEPGPHTSDNQPQQNDSDPAEAPDRNRYSRELSRVTPPGASPLPRAGLVRKKGYVLARISFRTIMTKKWKQSYWVQYGPHTMLWFRSEADFDDWLNNPYHSQSQRNFLFKLAVNFVHDVREYKVTQCRTKGYGKKMVRQFKLERWMDYGPTIAAAFGSYDPKEVEVLREALVDCMRNTPLSGGIRATGVVRHRKEEDSDDHSHSRQNGQDRAGSFDSNTQHQAHRRLSDDTGEEADLLDVTNWDDGTLREDTTLRTSRGGGEPDLPTGAAPNQGRKRRQTSLPESESVGLQNMSEDVTDHAQDPLHNSNDVLDTHIETNPPDQQEPILDVPAVYDSSSESGSEDELEEAVGFALDEQTADGSLPVAVGVQIGGADGDAEEGQPRASGAGLVIQRLMRRNPDGSHFINEEVLNDNGEVVTLEYTVRPGGGSRRVLTGDETGNNNGIPVDDVSC